MNIWALLLIIIGFIVILNIESILDYTDKYNQNNEKPVNRQIMKIRLLTSSIFVIILGIINFL